MFTLTFDGEITEILKELKNPKIIFGDKIIYICEAVNQLSTAEYSGLPDFGLEQYISGFYDIFFRFNFIFTEDQKNKIKTYLATPKKLQVILDQQKILYQF